MSRCLETYVIDEFQPQFHYRKQIVKIEKRLSGQEQYTRRECVELVGFATELHGDQLEDYQRAKFHVIHRLRNKKVMIARLVNRQDALKVVMQII